MLTVIADSNFRDSERATLHISSVFRARYDHSGARRADGTTGTGKVNDDR